MSPPLMSALSAQALEARRRKVRKGTHSCWECRRRKIRCQYASQDDVVCIGCRARGSACRSQEFADELPPQAVPEKKVAQRLDRLESMMEQLMSHVLTTPGSNDGALRSAAGRAAHDRRSSSVTGSDGPFLPDASYDEDDKTTTVHGHGHDHDHSHDHDLDNEAYRRDPAKFVAHVCPTEAGKQGYGVLDVLETSTADDTPVAALLGIQDSLSNSAAAPRASASEPTPAPAPAPVSAAVCAASSTQRSASGGPPTAASTGSGLSPASLDTGVHGPSSTSSPAGGGGSTSVSCSARSFKDVSSMRLGSTLDSPGTATTSADLQPTDRVLGEYARQRRLSKVLHSLFPTQEDVNTIVTDAASRFVVGLFYSKHDIDTGRSECPSDLKVIPPVTSHPTVLARRLLQVTLCMQHMAPCLALQDILHLPDSLADVISRIAGVVNHTVTSNDELIGSVEGLECLILLGLQQSNAGQLRKAWLTYRRALSLAQLMGLDRGNTRALKSCDPASDPRTWPTPAALWYRINACDRYVSLLLGLRAGAQDDDGGSGSGGASGSGGGSLNARSSADDTDTPVEKLEKAHTALTGRIVERNHSKLSPEQAYRVTQAIDADLRAAAARNIAQTWWDVPSYDPYTRPDFIMSEMGRSIVQVHHHCILILLHLPYMLRGEHPAAEAARLMVMSATAPTGKCENRGHSMPGEEFLGEGGRSGCTSNLAYSKETCMQSSRAVLQRFLQFRQRFNTAFSCRHVDYASLIAAMTLIVGYLGPRPTGSADPNMLDTFDAHLRRDRAMVEQVRERMEHIGQTGADKLSRESAATIRQLLPILDLVARKPETAASAGGTAAPGGPPAAAATARRPPAAAAAAAAQAAAAGVSTGCPSDRSASASATPAPLPPGSYAADAGPGTPASAVRLNVPYFGTINFHAVGATGMSAMSPHYQQQQQQQQLQHQQHQPAEFGTPPPVSCEILCSPTGDLDWNGSTTETLQQQQHTHAHAPSQQPHDVGMDLNAMLVDFDPVPTIGDVVDGLAGHGDGMSSDGGADSFSGFGGPSAFPDLTGASDDWAMQGIDTTYWSLLNGGGGSFGGSMA